MDKASRYSSQFVILASFACVALVAYTMPTGRRGVGYATLGLLSICLRWLFAKSKPSVWLISPGVSLVLYYIWRSTLLQHGPPTEIYGKTFDLYALYVDGSFGIQPSIWVNHLFRSEISRKILQETYEGLPFAMGIAYASSLAYREKALKVFGCFAVAGALGMLCYRLLPICGPAYLPFGDQCFYYRGSCSTAPFFSGAPAWIEISLQWPRNGFPSLHMAWALLIWWSCRENRFGRWVGPIFVLLTAFSTLVYGEHYLIDLLAAFFFALIPWSLFLAKGSLLDPHRGLASASGSLGYLVWVVLVRYHADLFWVSPVVPWAASVISCIVPLQVVFLWGNGRHISVSVADKRCL
jgi:membrane-associated phospholipid phosphatase